MRSIILLLSAILISCTAWAEVPVVANGPEPRDGVSNLELEEIWRLGGPEDEETFFGLITWAEMGPDGLFYVLDGQLCQVNVYTPEGELVRTLFHEGEGPGEIRQPRDIVIMEDGSIGAVQEFPGKIIRVDAENNPLESINPRMGSAADGGFVALVSTDQNAGTLAVACIQIVQDTQQGVQSRNYYLAVVDKAGQVEQPLISHQVKWDFSRFVYNEEINLPSFFFANTVGPEGNIYAASRRNEYRIEVFQPDGTPVRAITRQYESRQRTSADKQWVFDMLDGAFRQVPFPYEIEVSDTDSDFHWLGRPLQVDQKGNLWTLPSRGIRNQPSGVLATFDVFNSQGIFTRQVQVKCPGDGSRDGVFMLGQDHVLVIKGHVNAIATLFGSAPEEDGEAEAMEIICYKVK